MPVTAQAAMSVGQIRVPLSGSIAVSLNVESQQWWRGSLQRRMNGREKHTAAALSHVPVVGFNTDLVAATSRSDAVQEPLGDDECALSTFNSKVPQLR